MRCALPSLLLLLFVALPAAGQGTDPPDDPPAEPRVKVKLLGGYRVGFQAQEAFPIDRVDGTFDQSLWLDHRLRVHPRVLFGDHVVLGADVDLLTGMMGGHLPDGTIASDERLRWDNDGTRHAEIRQFYLGIYSHRPDNPPVMITLGMVADHWGLGAMANDGGPAGAGFTRSPFGTDQFGDRAIRVGMQLNPPDAGAAAGPLSLEILLDLVARDDDARLFARSDVSLGPAARIRYTDERGSAGLWVGWRTKRACCGGMAEILIGDLFADGTVPLGHGDGSVRLAFEAIGQAGRTDLATGWPDLVRRSVLAGGAVADLELDLPGLAPVIGLRGGITSGDGDPTDDRETELRLDRDFNAGLILFDEVLAGATARRAVQVHELSGIDAAHQASEGAVAGAAFALPYISFRPAPVIDLRVGGLIAVATADPIHILPADDPAAGIDGVTLTRGRRFLGGEIDASVQIDMPLVPEIQTRTRFGLRVEYGHLFPGSGLTEGWTTPVPSVDRLSVRMGMTF